MLHACGCGNRRHDAHSGSGGNCRRCPGDLDRFVARRLREVAGNERDWQDGLSRPTGGGRTGAAAGDPGRGKESREPGPRAGNLLQAERNRDDGGHGDACIVDVFEIGTAATIERVSKQCVRDGLEAALDRIVQVNRKMCFLDGEGDAKPVIPVCSTPSSAQARWRLSRRTGQGRGAQARDISEVSRNRPRDGMGQVASDLRRKAVSCAAFRAAREGLSGSESSASWRRGQAEGMRPTDATRLASVGATLGALPATCPWPNHARAAANGPN